MSVTDIIFVAQMVIMTDNLFHTNGPWYLISLCHTEVLTVESHLQFVKFTADMLTLQ